MQTLQTPNYAFWPLPDRLDSHRMQLQFCTFSLLAAPRHSALDETVGVGLRGIHFSILASVLQAFVPAEICRGFQLALIHQ